MTCDHTIKRVGMLFSGGPAPAANAVISAAALGLLNDGVEVIGFLDGYENLQAWTPETPLVEGVHYLKLGVEDVAGIRNRKDIILRTSRANPGKSVKALDDLADPEKNQGLMAVFGAFEQLGIDGLLSIGGDDTLKTANYVYRMQEMVQGLRRVSVVHLPKTIDNDYFGIDWTFGFTSAANYAAKEILNIGADARSTKSWWVLEIMGRKAGWLTYAAGIAGEATKMISVEDLAGGEFDLRRCALQLVDLIEQRSKHGRNYGIVCVAEGLAEHLPASERPVMAVDDHGNPVLGSVQTGEVLAEAMEEEYAARTGSKIRVRSKQIGYEARCTEPVAFDVMLGCQLGIGAARAICAGTSGKMISVRDQLEIVEVDFASLIDPATLKTRIRMVERDSDFYRLARALEYQRAGSSEGTCAQ